MNRLSKNRGVTTKGVSNIQVMRIQEDKDGRKEQMQYFK